MTTKTTKQKLQDLHDLMATTLCEAIQEGVPVKDDAGNVSKAPAPAALLNVARQFLKDNNVEAVAVPGSKLHAVATSLPFATPDAPSPYDEYSSTH